jgi:hypothetical protein
VTGKVNIAQINLQTSKFTSLDVFTLCFSEKLPAAGNLALYSEGNDIK